VKSGAPGQLPGRCVDEDEGHLVKEVLELFEEDRGDEQVDEDRLGHEAGVELVEEIGEKEKPVLLEWFAERIPQELETGQADHGAGEHARRV